MKILHISSSDAGGAGIAMLRLHRALANAGVESRCFVFHKFGENHGVERIVARSVFEKVMRGLGAFTNRILMGCGWGHHYLGLWPTYALRCISESDADIVHFHWPLAEMMSVEQMAKIQKPTVWTCHDMWLFSGSTGYSDGVEWWAENHRKSSRWDTHIAWVDRWIFSRKQKAWINWQPAVVSPSRWMADCVLRSRLFGGAKAFTVPNCLDINIFKPLNNRLNLRAKYRLSKDKKIILFGACKLSDHRKGRDLLEQALTLLENKRQYTLAIFGASGLLGVKTEVSGVDAVELGQVSLSEDLAELYNLADVMCVPSRQDNLPNTAVEAISCGTPVVAFHVGGLADIVDHQETGYLVVPFSVNDFARGIEWVAEQSTITSSECSGDPCLRDRCRQKALASFSPSHVATQYQKVYTEILSGTGL